MKVNADNGVSRLLFENARVRVTDLRLPALAAVSLLHTHPTVRWMVGDGTHSISGLPAVTVPDKDVKFFSAGSSLHLANKSDDEYRQVAFEILQPPHHSEAEVKRLLDAAIYPTDVGTKLLLENEWCRVWDFYLPPGGGAYEDVHHHVLDYVFVYVAAGRLLGSHADGTPGLFDSINVDGDVTWFDIPDSAPSDPAYAHGGVNGYADQPMREYLVELK